MMIDKQWLEDQLVKLESDRTNAMHVVSRTSGAIELAKFMLTKMDEDDSPDEAGQNPT